MEYELNHVLEVMFIVGHPEFHRNSWPESQSPIILTTVQVTLGLMSPTVSINIAELWYVNPVPK
jgi:hypothetical protein